MMSGLSWFRQAPLSFPCFFSIFQKRGVIIRMNSVVISQPERSPLFSSKVPDRNHIQHLHGVCTWSFPLTLCSNYNPGIRTLFFIFSKHKSGEDLRRTVSINTHASFLRTLKKGAVTTRYNRVTVPLHSLQDSLNLNDRSGKIRTVVVIAVQHQSVGNGAEVL